MIIKLSGYYFASKNMEWNNGIGESFLDCLEIWFKGDNNKLTYAFNLLKKFPKCYKT